jgi:K+-transporting ATPase ATPase A chain
MADVYGGKTMWLAFLERPIYRVLGVDRKVDQTWTRYAASLLIFSRITSSNL